MGYVEKIRVIMRFSVSGNNDIHSIAVKIQLEEEMCLYAKYVPTYIALFKSFYLLRSETPLVIQTTYYDILPCDKCNSVLVTWCLCTMCALSSLLLHCGSSPDHSPLASQVLRRLPSNS